MTGQRRNRERQDLATLERRDDFVRRHIGPNDDDIAAMLAALECDSLDALTAAAVPDAIRVDALAGFAAARTEPEVLAEARALAERNRVFRSMIGMGYHGCHMPTVVLRNLLENPGWYTAYTPYQPEISQGRLEALLNFQTMIVELTGMDLANASMLDEATAAAEAMSLCRRVSRGAGTTFFVSEDCHPQTIAVVQTRAEALDIPVVVGDHRHALDGDGIFGMLLQYPASTGTVHDYRATIEAAHAAGALVVVAADPLSLVLLTPPGEFGADVVVGSTQRFGVPMGFGGPHAAYFATRDAYKRAMPGRLVGVSLDAKGRPALRLALQTREQHIRRDKATSNICTAQVLLAVIAAMYAAYHGASGLRAIAARVHRLTAILADGLTALGFKVETEHFFDTIAVRTGAETDAVLARAAAREINLRRIDDGRVGITLDETTTRADVAAVWAGFADSDAPGLAIEELDQRVAERIPEALRRTTPCLTHPVFERYHSETDMLRYLRRLQDKDIALDRAMIPLGSCTMKLNATTEMIPITWPGFADLHPYAPRDQAAGSLAMIGELEEMLCRLTGYDAVSLQPNAGSQGEYSGLRAIRAYHESRGEAGRRVCLIPSSAHGTNPASATLAGLHVVVVDCDAHGNIDVGDLEAKAATHADELAALMVTYPSTHGVFEEAIVEICDIVHGHGGQVYMDGANMNALVGVALPGRFGADIGHLNLHKTFCIPHGGGGPGVGPVGARAHLAPFLPGHPLGEDFAFGGAPVAAAPWGSAGILPISWAYIALMGGVGLKKATQVAILNANYVARRLSDHYPVLYTGPGGLVAHECIIDLRPLKAASGVEVDDVAKRLMDYGFHAPTMSFPVPGTLMIEPTESEPLSELDRFCDAMIAIRAEIRQIEDGVLDHQDNPLKNAPHTAEDLVTAAWDHPYSRETAVFPVDSLRADKFWPPVGRIDNVYGDRHLVCACPPLDAYRDAAE